jgi:hypothetical protein
MCFALEGGSQTLIEMAGVIMKFDKYSRTLISPPQLLMQCVVELHILLSLYLCKVQHDGFDLNPFASRMALCYASASTMVRVMPSYNDGTATAFHPILPAPALASSIFAQEFAVWILSTVCTCIIHVPEIYFIAYPERTTSDLKQEFVILLRLLSCGLATLLEFTKNMRCGLGSAVVLPSLYRIGKDMRIRSTFLTWNAETELLMSQLESYARQILAVLSTRFLIAGDLLRRLDDEVQPGVEEPVDHQTNY